MAVKRHPADSPGGARAVEPVVLVVLDGVGIGTADRFDAVHVARTPNLDRLSRESPQTAISAHGRFVGLPDADAGNSEVGHNTMGAGRIVDQGVKRIDSAMRSGEIWGRGWRAVVAQVLECDSTLHLIGLLSDGNVHSSTSHLWGLVDRARTEGLRRVRVHVLLDGRDVPDHTAEFYVAELELALAAARAQGLDYRIASGGGRMTTTMDRYGADWRVVERGWSAHVLGEATGFPSAAAAIEASRSGEPELSDQLIAPFTIVDAGGRPVGPICDDDAVVLFNFRGDRMMQFLDALTARDFTPFDRRKAPAVLVAAMTLYDADTDFPPLRLVERKALSGTIGEHLARARVTQLACTETQKFGHLTYFWNGNRSKPFAADLETYVEIPSDQVAFDQRPWMKSAEIADEVIEALERGEHSLIRVNLAGGDMVGHTGRFESTVVAMESIDLAIGRISAAVARRGGHLVVTADHGNAEDMVERGPTGEPLLRNGDTLRWRTAHSTNQVPFIAASYTADRYGLADVSSPGLANLAATLMTLLRLPVPPDYAPSLLVPLERAEEA